MNTLSDKVILVKGAIRENGAAIATQMALAGASVIVNYAKGKERILG